MLHECNDDNFEESGHYRSPLASNDLPVEGRYLIKFIDNFFGVDLVVLGYVVAFPPEILF